MGNLMSLGFGFRMSLTKEERESVGRDEDRESNERGEKREILKKIKCKAIVTVQICTVTVVKMNIYSDIQRLMLVVF